MKTDFISGKIHVINAANPESIENESVFYRKMWICVIDVEKQFLVEIVL